MNISKVGEQIKEFNTHNQEGKEVKLSDYKGEKVIVFFYPKASTPGCTAEACSLRDHFEELKGLGYTLLGVSADSPKRQTNFRDKYEFPFDLLADENHEVINAFGVWGPKTFMGREYDGIHRVTFVLDEDARVTHVVDKVTTKTHGTQLLELLTS